MKLFANQIARDLFALDPSDNDRAQKQDKQQQTRTAQRHGPTARLGACVFFRYLVMERRHPKSLARKPPERQ
ncbi:hypothetical protein GCM10023115_15030 [Pontixanthobacter gangjinensis]